jgi:Thaumatin family
MRTMFGAKRAAAQEGRPAAAQTVARAAAMLAVLVLTAGCAALGTGNGGAAATLAASAARPGGSGPGATGPGATGPGTTGAKPGRSAAGKTTASASPTAAKPGSAHPATPAGTAKATPPESAPSPTDPAASVPPPSGAAGQRRVTFLNHMTETIWVAAAPSATSPLSATGWVLPAGQSVTITAPDNLNTRFWGRTGCVFSSAGTGRCQTGDCGGLFQCKGWGTIPATLAEVNFDAWRGMDFYDVSMVDGSNLPVFINVTKSSGGTTDKISQNGCVAAGCTKPVDCPRVLDVQAGGKVVGCISACARLGGDQYCCRGQWSSRAACNPAKWPVDYAAVFKRAEPYAYSYVDDDATSVFTCSGVCDYRITFGLTSLAASVVRCAHHHDRAARVVHAVLADRAEQRLGEAAVPPAADNQQVRVLGGVEQGARRVFPDDHRVDYHSECLKLHVGDGLVKGGLGGLPGAGSLVRRSPAELHRRQPGGHRVDLGAGQPGLAHRPGKRGPGRVRLVDSHHNPSAPCQLRLHRCPPRAAPARQCGIPAPPASRLLTPMVVRAGSGLQGRRPGPAGA